MNRIVLEQPHATLVVIGEQRILTYDYQAAEMLVGQRFAIHAAAKPPTEGQEVGEWFCTYRPDVTIDNAGESFTVPGRWIMGRDIHGEELASRLMTAVTDRFGRRAMVPDIHPLPLGAVVATAVLADCVPILHYERGSHAFGWRGRLEAGIQRWVQFVPEHRIDGNYGGEIPAGLKLMSFDDMRKETPLLSATDISDQLPYGDFTPGRWAWLLDSVEPCDPIPDSIIVPDYNTQGE